MKIKFLNIIVCVLLLSCGDNRSTQQTEESKESVVIFDNKGHELVYNMVQKVGDYRSLLDKKDVIYTYTYKTADGKVDVATEKYLFDGELSYGLYDQHERTIPQLEGAIEQGYDGNEYWLKHDEKLITDQPLIDKVMFNRPTNLYWFAMMPKLLDPNVVYHYIGETVINEATYDIVKVSFNIPTKENTDIYQVYINQDSGLVDQFLFTVAAYNVIDVPYLMELKYESIDGLLIPTQRKYQKSNWDGVILNGPFTEVTWTDISFNNGLTIKDFKK